MSLYKTLIRPLLFTQDAEAMHDASIRVSATAGSVPGLARLARVMTRARDARLETEVCGLRFENPVGLAAGYDKSGHAVDGLAGLGFGHIEVGSVSIDPSQGNPMPRLFRLPEDEAVLVHYGLQNDGAEIVASRLSRRSTRIPVGVNIVKTNRGIDAPAEREDAILDEYVRAVRRLEPVADYLMLNLSCPNTETGRDFFGEPGHIRNLMQALADTPVHVPLFLKISPLGGVPAIERVLQEVDAAQFVSGFMFNLAPGQSAPLRTPPAMREPLPGSLAGRPVQDMMNACLRELYTRMDASRYSIISAGGVFTAEDAYAKIRMGASLVQLLTGLVYEGPMAVKRICRGLSRLLERDGMRKVGEAVGVG